MDQRRKRVQETLRNGELDAPSAGSRRTLCT